MRVPVAGHEYSIILALASTWRPGGRRLSTAMTTPDIRNPTSILWMVMASYKNAGPSLAWVSMSSRNKSCRALFLEDCKLCTIAAITRTMEMSGLSAVREE